MWLYKLIGAREIEILYQNYPPKLHIKFMNVKNFMQVMSSFLVTS